MKESIYKVSCIVIGSKCAVLRSTSQLVDVAAFVRYYCKKLNSLKHLVRTNVAESHN